MPYRVDLAPAAHRQWKKLSADMRARLAPAIAGLSNDLRPHGCEKLADEDAYRIRLGGYRVVYGIDDAGRVVTVTKIAKRDEVYR